MIVAKCHPEDTTQLIGHPAWRVFIQPILDFLFDNWEWESGPIGIQVFVGKI